MQNAFNGLNRSPDNFHIDKWYLCYYKQVPSYSRVYSIVQSIVSIFVGLKILFIEEGASQKLEDRYLMMCPLKEVDSAPGEHYRECHHPLHRRHRGGALHKGRGLYTPLFIYRDRVIQFLGSLEHVSFRYSCK